MDALCHGTPAQQVMSGQSVFSTVALKVLCHLPLHMPPLPAPVTFLHLKAVGSGTVGSQPSGHNSLAIWHGEHGITKILAQKYMQGQKYMGV